MTPNEVSIALYRDKAAGYDDSAEFTMPLRKRTIALLQLQSGQTVLDVGCGTGRTTVAAAARLGPGGRCVGVDISEPMLAAARTRAAEAGAAATFVCADAQDHGFAPGGVDLVLSRFGVMFFLDHVAAFANLRRATTGLDTALLDLRGKVEGKPPVAKMSNLTLNGKASE